MKDSNSSRTAPAAAVQPQGATLKQSGVTDPVRDVVLTRREFDAVVEMVGVVADRLQLETRRHGSWHTTSCWVLSDFDNHVERLRQLRWALERKQIGL